MLSQLPPQSLGKSEVEIPGFRLVGKVKDAHGLKGELFVVSYAGQADWVADIKVFKLLNPIRETVQEYSVKKAKEFKNGAIILAEGLSNRNQAEALKGFLFYLPSDIFVSQPGDQFYLSEIEGFEVHDEKLGFIGKIVGFSSNG